MEVNYWVFPVAALVPLIIGSIWYNPKVLGAAWMKASGVSDEDVRSGNMAVIFGLTFLFALMLSTMVYGLVVHQSAMASVLLEEEGYGEEGSEVMIYEAEFHERYGDNYRTFGHGVFHGIIAGLFIALPIIGIISLFERRGFKYIAIHTGYWTLTLALMGGILCQLA